MELDWFVVIVGVGKDRDGVTRTEEFGDVG